MSETDKALAITQQVAPVLANTAGASNDIYSIWAAKQQQKMMQGQMPQQMPQQ